MAGAVSAGAYSAGVMDYLLETLELWEEAKSKNRRLGKNDPRYDHSIPMHDVEIDVISGASAGGICGTLTLLSAVDRNYKSYNQNNTAGLNNVFYSSWVEMGETEKSSTLDKLLDLSDFKKFKEVRSLLNTLPIDNLADEALKIKELKNPPPYISKNLDLILTTTNLRGLNFLIDFEGTEDSSSGTVITTHGGFFRYRLKNDSNFRGIPEGDELYYVLDLSLEKDRYYLKEATLSTAAFPIGLAAREAAVSATYTERYPRYLFGKAKGIRPILPNGSVYKFNSVDGGVINNEPYGIGVKVLREKNPEHILDNKYAVIMIDPFPVKDHDVEQESGRDIVSIAKGLFKALRNQVMFNQDGILEALELEDRTKFMIAPVRKIRENGSSVAAENALAAGPLNGFAGFLNRDFREHDFQLGRKNCQAFLRYYFALKKSDVEKRLGAMPTETMLNRFQFSVPPMDPEGEKFFPIIPDMRVLNNFKNMTDSYNYGKDAEIEAMPYPKMSFSDFEKRFKSKIKNRIGEIVKYLLNNRFLSFLANTFYAKNAGYKVIRDAVQKELSENDLLQ